MASSMFPITVEIISKEMLKPQLELAHDRQCNLTPWDMTFLGFQYIQKGLLFTDIPHSLPTHLILTRLKISLATALSHFYPLSGRLLIEKRLNEDGQIAGLHVSIDCNDAGVDFIHAVARDITVTDFLSPGEDTPTLVNSFFPFNGTMNYEGHSIPLLSIQVTELAGGSAIFLACCFNHVAGDGVSYWNFFNAWAEISRTDTLARPPFLQRFFIEGENSPIMLPFSDLSQLEEPFKQPILRERFFHFSGDTVAKLKARANEEVGTGDLTISSFLALSAFIWRAITRARGIHDGHLVSCHLAIQNRGRVRPALPPDYFGNCLYKVFATVAAGELLRNGIGWAARKLSKAVADHTDPVIRGLLRSYLAAPSIFRLTVFDPSSVMMGSSPRFDMYGCDFGWGKPAAVRSGVAHKFDGKVSSFPGRDGGGSVDLEICLAPEFMAALLQDGEFMDAISTAPSPFGST